MSFLLSYYLKHLVQLLAHVALLWPEMLSTFQLFLSFFSMTEKQTGKLHEHFYHWMSWMNAIIHSISAAVSVMWPLLH